VSLVVRPFRVASLCPLDEGFRLSEPRALPTLQVSRHAGFLVEDLLRPLARLRVAALCGKKGRVVVIGLREDRELGRLAEERLCLRRTTELRIRVREQRGAAIEVVLGIASVHLCEITGRSLEIPELDLGDTASVLRVVRVHPWRDGLVVRGARLGPLPFLEIQVRELLVIPRGGILQNQRFEILDPLLAPEGIEGLPDQAEIRNYFEEDIDRSTEGTEEHDHVQPDRVGSPLDEVDDRDRLENQPPRKQEREEAHAVDAAKYSVGVLSEARVMNKLTVGIYVFDEVEVLDFAGPFEVFSRTRLVGGVDSRRSDDSAPFEVVTLGKTGQSVKATGGLVVVPHHSWATAPSIDLLVVPGGFGTRALLGDREVIEWIAAAAARARQVTSVCTGALLLARAGLLQGRRATTHWGAYDLLASIDGSIDVVRNQRVVRDGVVSSAGVSAGIDMAFEEVERLCGKAVADETARYIEYPRLQRDGLTRIARV